MTEVGFIYILSNANIKDEIDNTNLLKIGRTTDMKTRLKKLNNTSIPSKFDLLRCIKVDNYKKKEKMIHSHFRDNRISTKREFFSCSIDEVNKVFDNYLFISYCESKDMDINNIDNIIINNTEKDEEDEEDEELIEDEEDEEENNLNDNDNSDENDENDENDETIYNFNRLYLKKHNITVYYTTDNNNKKNYISCDPEKITDDEGFTRTIYFQFGQNRFRIRNKKKEIE